MRIVNTELLRPANLVAIAIVIVLVNWVSHHAFVKHVIDERKRARFGKDRPQRDDSGDESGE